MRRVTLKSIVMSLLDWLLAAWICDKVFGDGSKRRSCNDSFEDSFGDSFRDYDYDDFDDGFGDDF